MPNNTVPAAAPGRAARDASRDPHRTGLRALIVAPGPVGRCKISAPDVVGKCRKALCRSKPPIAAMAFLVSMMACNAFAASVRDPAIRAKIDAVIEHERLIYGGTTPVPGVLVGVWDKAGGSYVQAYGAADIATRQPLRPNDHFRIGSNTKTFVVSVILQLVDEGKLRLEDPLSRFNLGLVLPNAQHITVRQLCNMRSGLFEAYDVPQLTAADVKPTTIYDPRILIRWAMAQKPYFPPGAGYHYSNTNYLILGLIIESLTHAPVGESIRTRMIVPFHLEQTSYPTTQAMPEPWAHGYGLPKSGVWEDVSGTIPVSLMGAAGAMISDLGDMRRWVKLYVTGAMNRPATQRDRLDCLPTGEGNLSFGLGIGCSAGWYGYTGGLPGYNTAGYYLPAEDLTIISWVTLQADKPSPGVANAVFRDIATILSPKNVPYDMGMAGGGVPMHAH